MTTHPVLRRVLRLAVIVLAAGVLAAGVLATSPALLPAVRLQASTSAAAESAAADPAAPASPAADAGVIAYVKRSTTDIHLISPDGTNDRVLWTNPNPGNTPVHLGWRRDGLELAFSSPHEATCSFYDSDIYAIRSDGTGYRRVTNAPACAGLAALPKGTVTVEVQDSTGNAFVYVAGAPGIKKAVWGTMTFDNVADFGAGVVQPAVAIVAQDRTLGSPPFADVQPGQTLPGGNLIVNADSSFRGWGAGRVSWKADGAVLGYNMRNCSAINAIAAVPTFGRQGDALPVVPDASPCIQTWNPTLAGSDQYLYYSDDPLDLGEPHGIFLNTVGDASGGTRLYHPPWYANGMTDIVWLPDGSGFLYNEYYMGGFEPTHSCAGTWNNCRNIFEYDFATQQITQLTDLDDETANRMTVSPDGQHIVFERTPDPLIDLTSSLWIMNRDGIGPAHAHRRCRPAGLGSRRAAVAPTVGISRNGTNIRLSWTDNPINTGGYVVWYSEKPYFQPGDTGATSVNLPAGSTGWTHTGAAGNPAHNYSYLVQGVGAGGAKSWPSNRTGGFNFGLTPGS